MITKDEFKELTRKVDEIHNATVANKIDTKWYKMALGVIFGWLTVITKHLIGN